MIIMPYLTLHIILYKMEDFLIDLYDNLPLLY